MLRGDTIVAPATPPGEGGVGIVRLSGPRSEELLRQVFRPRSRRPLPWHSHRLYPGHVQAADGSTIDEVLAVVMRAPHSYTREDVVEIQGHGGRVVQRAILDLFLSCGARLAAPGEFTLRAFLNGRLDLSQAEAVIDLIRSRSEQARRQALAQLEGRLSRSLHGLRSRLLTILALIEAHIDFPEEELPQADCVQLASEVTGVQVELTALLHSYDQGRLLRDGASLLIVGRPNVGKSSLLNALVGEARAIVTEIPGTTRDLIEAPLSLGGVPLNLIDSAGLRATRDPVELEGVRRTRGRLASADLLLLVVDGSQPLQAEDFSAAAECPVERTLLVVNKSDLGRQPLPPEFSTFTAVAISAREGVGLAALSEAIAERLLGEGMLGEGDALLLADRRHFEALARASEALARFLSSLERGLAPELLALELHEALDAVGLVTGETTPGEILDQIFSRFCIGK